MANGRDEASNPACCVGVDGLALGTHVVVAVDGVIETSFDITDDGGRPVDLEARVAMAVGRAAAEVDCEVGEVRLVCVDDGADGQCIGRIGDRLIVAGIRFQVLDVIGPISDVAIEPPADQRSLDRARGAALW